MEGVTRSVIKSLIPSSLSSFWRTSVLLSSSDTGKAFGWLNKNLKTEQNTSNPGVEKKTRKQSACWNSPTCPLKISLMLWMWTVCLCGLCNCCHGWMGLNADVDSLWVWCDIFCSVYYCTALIIVVTESALYKLPYLDSLWVWCDTFCYSVLVYRAYHSFNWKRIIQVTLLNVHKIQLHLIAVLKIMLTCCERSRTNYHQVLKFKEAKEQCKSHLNQREGFSW